MVSNALFDITKPENFEVFRNVFGEPILDFGAGRLEDVELLIANGIDAHAFEPYCLTKDSDQINPAESRSLTDEFLVHVANGVQWPSIFLQAVLNSVPFHTDRLYVVAILAALAGPYTTLYTYTSGRHRSNYHEVKREVYHSTANRDIRFQLTYEPGIILGDYNRLPKVQKYFTLDEYVNLFQFGFQQVVSAAPKSGYLTAAFRAPRGIKPGILRAAIEFEFDLPYPDGSRLGKVGEALEAFSQRLGIDLMAVESEAIDFPADLTTSDHPAP